MIDLYRGRHYDKVSQSDRLVVNMAFANINIISPAIAVNNPKFMVNARSYEFAPQAVIAQEVLNYEWRAHKFQTEFRSATDDKLMIGHGWVKVGYKYVSHQPAVLAVEPEDNDPEVDVEGSEVPDDPSVETSQVVTEDRCTVERVSPFDVFVDPDARRPKELRWVAQRIVRPLADVKKDRSYSSKARRAVNGTLSSRWEHQEVEPAAGTKPESEKLGYVEVWEFWDIKRGTVQTFTLDGEEYLRAPKKSPFPFRNPFYMLRDYDVPDEFYPMGELEAIEVLQHELNETRTQMLNHRKKFSRKWLYRKSAFDSKDAIDALESDEDNVMVPVAVDEPIQNVIAALPAIITPPDFYNQSGLIQEDINLVTAVSEYARGNMPNIRRTATEAAMIQDGMQARSADKLAKVERELADIGMMLMQVIQTFITGEKVMRIAGADGVMHWATYDRDHIAGQFDYEVEAGSTQPQNETMKRQSAMQLVDALAPFAEVVNMPELAKYLLQEGFGVRNPERFIMLPQPMTQPGVPPEGDPAAQGMPPVSQPAA